VYQTTYEFRIVSRDFKEYLGITHLDVNTTLRRRREVYISRKYHEQFSEHSECVHVLFGFGSAGGQAHKLRSHCQASLKRRLLTFVRNKPNEMNEFKSTEFLRAIAVILHPQSEFFFILQSELARELLGSQV